MKNVTIRKNDKTIRVKIIQIKRMKKTSGIVTFYDVDDL